MSTQKKKKTSKEASFRAKQIKSLIRNSLNLYLMRCFVLSIGWILVNGCTTVTSEVIKEESLTQKTIRLGSILALEGQEEALGNNMKLGLEAALNGKIVQGKKRIEITFENDYYEPAVAKQKTRKLIDSGILLMIGNVGTPTAKETLPILSNKQVPMVGFLTGAQLLRTPSKSSELIINYRASYKQEIEKVVKMALKKKDIEASEICAYVQDDSYGKSGLQALRDSLKEAGAQEEILAFYDKYLDGKDTKSDRNQIYGPVGFYTRNTPDVELGYESLKNWEKTRGINCRLVVTAGTSSNIARFIKLAQDKENNWLISSLSFADAQELKLDLEEYGITKNVIMTQVVPLLDSDLAIVKEAKDEFKKQAESKFNKEAKSKFKDEFNNVFLEGFIVGKMTLEIIEKIPGEVNSKNFLKQIRMSKKFNLDGVSIDLTQRPIQASNLVLITELTSEGFQPLNNSSLAQHHNCENNPL